MWSAYFDTNPARTLSTRLLGTVSRRAYYGPFAPLRTRSIGKGTLPGRRWVRVRNFLAGISANEVALAHLEVDPRISSQALPRRSRIFLGREVVGEVVDVGPEVEFLRVGDRVAYQLDQCCYTRDIEPPCRHCAVGNYNLCENQHLPGPQAIGGGWGDEMVVHERQLFLVPDYLSDEQAALLEPTALSIHAALRRLPQPGESVLVLGADTLGLLTTQAIHAFAPNAGITVQPRHAFQVELATRVGASNILYSEDGAAGVARLTNAKSFRTRLGAEYVVGGFDVIYDTIGSAATLQNALRWARAGGTVVQVGMQLAPMAVDLTPLWREEVTLLGANGHGSENWPGGSGVSAWAGESGGRASTFSLAAALIHERKLTPQRLVTHRFNLRDLRIALATARNADERRAVKVLLDIRELAENPQIERELALREANGITSRSLQEDSLLGR